jgi:hypothetical protein
MTPGERALLVLAAVAVAWWLIDTAIWPYRPCRSCGGSGTKGPQGRRVYRICPACHRQQQLRLAARLVRPDLRRF